MNAEIEEVKGNGAFGDRSRLWVWSLIMIALALAAMCVSGPVRACENEVPGDDEDIFEVSGRRVKVIDGELYVCRGGQWVFNKTLVREGAKALRIVKSAHNCEVVNTRTGRRQSLIHEFGSGFDYAAFRDAFVPGQWTGTALLSPRVRTVKDYVALNKRLLQGSDFLDNRIDPESAIKRSGRGAFRFTAVAPAPGMVTSKSLIEKNDFCFGKGDDLWFSGWFFIAEGMPSTLVDFETRRLQEGPGVRIFIRRQRFASVELKFAHKPQYNQTAVELPTQRWVNLKLHLKLSNHDDGVVEMWQDGIKILDTRGQTLPTHDTVYNAMEVGITATTMRTDIVVDDIAVSRERI